MMRWWGTACGRATPFAGGNALGGLGNISTEAHAGQINDLNETLKALKARPRDISW